MRLVDADGIKLPKGFFEKIDNVPKFYEWLGTLPTVDAVEVVRCKDCKYYRTRWYGFCELIENENIHRDDNDFCSFGERRKDADT